MKPGKTTRRELTWAQKDACCMFSLMCGSQLQMCRFMCFIQHNYRNKKARKEPLSVGCLKEKEIAEHRS